ncbi:hypothetical protein PVAG01_00682 [Phlyctema vagabunda]|uniref:Uncharacterized protein n=1 Tax=Phlyctema vagabunda TaxID=108571 RepID=A0ABR4PUZ5_9HELO
MAPDLAILKRKRTAPASWWAVPTASPSSSLPRTDAPSRTEHKEPSQGSDTLDRSERKRSKGTKITKSSQTRTIEHNASPEGTVSDHSQQEAESSKQVPQDGEKQNDMEPRSSRRKRARPSDCWVVSQTESYSVDEPPSKKRSTSSNTNVVKGKKEITTAGAPQKSSTVPKILETISPPKRGRPAKAKSGETRQTGDAGSRKRLRSPQDIPEPDVVTATSSFAKSKSGQKRVVPVVPVERASKVVTKSKSASGKTHGSTTSASNKSQKLLASTTSKNKDSKKSKNDSQPAKRRRSTQERSPEQDAVAVEGPPPTYQHLAPITHRVPRHAIEKWEPLPFSSIERISQMLNSAERPVIMHLHDERKRNHASTAVGMITRRLVKKLSRKLPFPIKSPGMVDDDFDFENILNVKAVLEAQLTPALHANELLRAELWKEKVLLDAEEEALAELESNAKSESQQRKQVEKKAHALLQAQDAEEQILYKIGLDETAQRGHLPLSMSNNETLTALLKDVHGHVDSLQGNVGQIESIGEAITKSKAAVQATLFSHLGSDEYDAVTLG